jgi:hypothetical protein
MFPEIRADFAIPDCYCGIPAMRRKVMKVGPSTGRFFSNCSKDIEDQNRCKFFKLETPLLSDKQQRIGIDCHCGEPSALRVVSRGTINKGRLFYNCGKDAGTMGRCAFFVFESDASHGGTPTGGASPYRPQVRPADPDLRLRFVERSETARYVDQELGMFEETGNTGLACLLRCLKGTTWYLCFEGLYSVTFPHDGVFYNLQ